jgi:hypothetical protein
MVQARWWSRRFRDAPGEAASPVSISSSPSSKQRSGSQSAIIATAADASSGGSPAGPGQVEQDVPLRQRLALIWLAADAEHRALRIGIALTGANITQYGTQVLVGAGWLAASLIVASLTYRFTDE